MGFIENTLKEIPLPKIVKVEQTFDDTHLEDVEAVVRTQIVKLKEYMDIKPGQSIAITGGSRGINKIDIITKCVCDMVKAKGAYPFIVPAMGSHGGATAEGQKHMLETLGITEKAMGVPIKATMEVVKIGTFGNGRPIYMDKYAHDADGIILLNRVKAHTSFMGKYESGLMKMMAIGLGKQQGAENYHQTGFKEMPGIIGDVGKAVLRLEKVLFGVAILENSFGKVNKIACLSPNDIPEQEAVLLKESKKYLALPFFKNVDVMIVKEIGKNISGTGCDSNVTGRFNNESFHNDMHVTRLGFLQISHISNGNANGVGLGDFITKKLYENIDLAQLYPNALTSTAAVTVKIPMMLPTERDVFAAAIKTSCIENFKEVRLGIIESSKNLQTLYVSENMLSEAQEKAKVINNAFAIPFDAQGNLTLEFH